MAITITYRASVYSTSTGNLTATPTWTPAADSLLIACVATAYASSPADPTGVSGHGIAYSKLTLGTSTLPATSSTHILSIWVAKAGSSPTSAAATETLSGSSTGGVIIEFEVTGADVSGTALQAIQASTATNIGTTGTAHTVTLASPATALNRALTFCVQLTNANHTAAGSWTLTAGATGNFTVPSTGAVALFRNDAFDTAGAATGASVGWRMVGIEIKAQTTILLTASPGDYDVTGAAATETLGDVTWEVLDDTLGPTASTYSDTAATAGTTYLYRVVAVNASGETASNRDDVTTPSGPITVTAEDGSYTGTGAAVALALALTASAGAYTASGTSASVVAAAPLTAGSTSYSVTGPLATPTLGLTAATSSYTGTGKLATPTLSLTAASGSITVTGRAATVGALALPASAGSYAVTGAVASFPSAGDLTASAGGYTLIGTVATAAQTGMVLTASAGTLTQTGTPLLPALTLPLPVGSLTGTGAAASGAAGFLLTATRGTYTGTGVAATLPLGAPVTASAGSYTLTGKLTTLPSAAQLVVELRQGATLIATRTLTPGATAETLLSTLTAPERAAITDWTALRLAFTATGSTMEVTWAALRTPAPDLALVASPAIYSLTGAAVTIPAGFLTTATAGTLALTGAAATLRGDLSVSALAASYTLTGAPLSPLAALLTTASPAVYALTGVAMTDVAAGLNQATFVTAANAATSNATTISVTITAPAAAGDLAIVSVGHRGGTGGTISAVTAGWAAVTTQQNATTVLGTRLFSKTLTAGDIGVAHTFAFNTAAAVKGAIVAVVTRGSGIALLTQASQTNASQANIPCPGITFAPQGVLLLAIGDKAHTIAHTAISGWTLDAAATVTSTGGNATSNLRISAHYRTFQGQAPGGVTIPGGATAAVSTGHQLALAAGAAITLSSGSLEWTGIAATLRAEAPVPALVGALAQTGRAMTVALGLPVTASSYAATGAPATFATSAVLTAAPGAYSATGVVAGLESLGVFTLTAEPGTYSGTGVAAAVVAGYPVVAFAGAYTGTGRLATDALALTATATSYTVTGAAASGVQGGGMPALRGTYTATGVVLRHPLTARMDPATLTVVGKDASTLAVAPLTATRGSYTQTGVVAGLEFVGSFTVAAEPGTVSLTGASASLVHAEDFTASAGSLEWTGRQTGAAFATAGSPAAYALTGTAVTATAPSLVASAGSYSQTGKLANPIGTLVTPALAASYTLTGASTTEHVARAPVAALRGTYAATGSAATLTHDYTLTASGGTGTLTGKPATDLVRHDLPALAGSYTLTGRAAELAVPGFFALTAEPAVLALTGATATLRATFGDLTAAPAAYTLTGRPAGVLATALTLTATRGTYAATGAAATLQAAGDLTATAGSLTLTGAATDLLTRSLLIVSRGTLAITGAPLTTIATDILVANVGGGGFTEYPASLTIGLPLTRGTLTLTGQAATFSVAFALSAAPGVYAINGESASLVDVTTPAIEVCETSVVALTPDRTVVMLTPDHSVVSLAVPRTVEELCP